MGKGGPTKMGTSHSYTVEEVKDLIEKTLTPTFATTENGQAHLNRIAKAITNESIEKRKKTSQYTRAEAAFNKKLGEVAAKSQDKIPDFMLHKDKWIEDYIDRKYGSDED